MDPAALTIGGVGLITLIIGLVQFIKKAGVTGNTLTYVAMGLGCLFGGLYKLTLMFPITQPWVELLVFTLAFGVAGLAATGIYDLATQLAKSSSSPVTISGAPITIPIQATAPVVIQSGGVEVIPLIKPLLKKDAPKK